MLLLSRDRADSLDKMRRNTLRVPLFLVITPRIGPRDGSTAPLIQGAMQRGMEIGKGLGGDDALTAHPEKGVEAD